MPEIPNFISESATVQKNEPIAQGVYLMRLHAPRLATASRPAQFLQILTDPGSSPYLRRPFSVLRADRNAGWLDLIYDVIGPGTERLSAAQCGDQFDISGPLGNPFAPRKPNAFSSSQVASASSPSHFWRGNTPTAVPI